MVDITRGLLRRNLLLAATLSALVGVIVVGTVVYHYLEDWTWVESFYFTVCTVTTIGYGDIHPTSDASRLFTAFFALAGVAIALAAFGIIGGMYLRRGEQMLARIAERGKESERHN